MNAFYVFDDTELAKEDFNKFGFQDPCRHRNIGEKYLRLYGILNSFYQQFLALINLMKLFRLKQKKEHITKLRDSDFIKLRNKIESHPTNYLQDKNSTQFDVYEISRHNLEEEIIKLQKNQKDFEAYNLNNAISSSDKMTQIVLSDVSKKFVKKKFNNQRKVL